MAKQRKAQRQGRCAFCGEVGVSREHVMPQWVRELPGVRELREAADNHRGKVVNRTMYVSDGIVRPTVVIGAETGGSRRHSTNTILRRVCKECNNQWMSALEDETRPLVTALEGSTGIQTIDADDADVLARWAFKTAAVYELDDNQTRAIAPADVLGLRDGQGLPAERVEVYVFHLADPERQLGLDHVGGPISVGVGTPKVHSAFIAAGTVTVMRLGLLVRYTNGLRLEYLDPVADSRVLRIFPFTGPVEWPASIGLSNAETKKLCQALFGSPKDADYIRSMAVPLVANPA